MYVIQILLEVRGGNYITLSKKVGSENGQTYERAFHSQEYCKTKKEKKRASGKMFFQIDQRGGNKLVKMVGEAPINKIVSFLHKENNRGCGMRFTKYKKKTNTRNTVGKKNNQRILQ